MFLEEPKYTRSLKTILIYTEYYKNNTNIYWILYFTKLTCMSPYKGDFIYAFKYRQEENMQHGTSCETN